MAMAELEGDAPRSPGHMRMSLAAAMTLGYQPGLFYRDARLYCINLLLTYPEGCRARCAYCGLSAERPGTGLGKSFIRVQWPTFPLDDIIEKIAERR
jgi:biotin synthase